MMDHTTKAGFNLVDNGEKKMGPPPSYAAAATSAAARSGGPLPGEPPAAFYVKKWILLVTMFFNMAGLVIGLFCLDYIVEMVVHRSVAMGKLVVDPDNEAELAEMMVRRAFLISLSKRTTFFFAPGDNQEHQLRVAALLYPHRGPLHLRHSEAAPRSDDRLHRHLHLGHHFDAPPLRCQSGRLPGHAGGGHHRRHRLLLHEGPPQDARHSLSHGP